MNHIGIYDMVTALVEVVKPEEVALRTKVSLSTVNRWIAQKSKPQPRQESLLREMFLEYFPEGGKKALQSDELDNGLAQLREVFHKSSRFSSRNEALEEIAKLFFAHITSVMQHGTGICEKIVCSEGKEAASLCQFVAGQFERYLRKDNRIDLTSALKLKESENKFASEIISIFEKFFSHKEVIEQLKGTEALNEIFGKFLADSFVDEKQLGQYLTPHEVVDFSTELLYAELNLKDVVNDDFGLVLDPSCGIGSFLASFINKTFKESIRTNEHFDINQFIKEKVYGIDKSERMIKLALINLAMYGCSNINVYLKNALDSEDIGLDGKVSVILTNPPFGAEFPAKEIGDFRIVKQWSDKKPQKVNSEIVFLEKYLDWLKPGGYLICVIPDSILNNKGIYQALRNGIAKQISIKAVISLPQNTFATTGTETKTSLVFIQKKDYDTADRTYLAICKNIGYDVVTSGTHKVKRYNDASDLKKILQDYRQGTNRCGEWVTGLNAYFRWDAAYHASVPNQFVNYAQSVGLLKVKDVASLSQERFNPARYESDRVFHYIEISGIDSIQMRAYAKEIRCGEAPSRARKLVHSNNIIFSTVRPERGTVAVIDDTQDNFVCTTGFAVLETQRMEPMVLAYLLQSDFVAKQIGKYVMGISYPVIDEKDLMEIYLPINSSDIRKYDGKASVLKEKEREVTALRKEFKDAIKSDINSACLSITEIGGYL